MPDLVMAVTRNIVNEYKLELPELHNDSTTVRFYGDYDQFEEPVLRREKTTVAIRQGHSKDHRPDLKQLLYILTVSDDGGVPVYLKEVSRIEALLCVYFLVLVIQTLLERDLRGAMAKSEI